MVESQIKSKHARKIKSAKDQRSSVITKKGERWKKSCSHWNLISDKSHAGLNRCKMWDIILGAKFPIYIRQLPDDSNDRGKYIRHHVYTIKEAFIFAQIVCNGHFVLNKSFELIV